MLYGCDKSITLSVIPSSKGAAISFQKSESSPPHSKEIASSDFNLLAMTHIEQDVHIVLKFSNVFKVLENWINAGTVYHKIEVVFVLITPLLFDKVNTCLQDRKNLILCGYLIELPSILGKTAKGTSHHNAASLFRDSQGPCRTDPDAVSADLAVVFINDRSALLKGDDPVQTGFHTGLSLAALLISDHGFCCAVYADYFGFGCGTDI
jgi:hypothetical protein